MTPKFRVLSTPRFERLFRRLLKGHRDVLGRYMQTLQILASDPFGGTGRHDIKKPAGVKTGEGQWRLRLGRWRFRYDVLEREVAIHYCGLRREDTY